MKVGILTYHRAHNYGAILQGLALREAIKMLGHESYFIDYWPEHHRNVYTMRYDLRLREPGKRAKLHRIKNMFSSFPQKYFRLKQFNRFINEYVEPLVIPYSTSTKLDAVVYGSDQIWWRHWKTGEFDAVYYGDHIIDSKKHIAYAASMGTCYRDNDAIKFIKRQLIRFSGLGVREDELVGFLHELGFNDACQVIDPTFLLTASDWNEMFPVRKKRPKPYMLYYDKGQQRFDERALKKYAESHGMDLCVLRASAKNWFSSDSSLDHADPYDFLDLIRGAEVVFTSSFHGLAFALIFNKPVYVAATERPVRMLSLLRSVEIENSWLHDPNVGFPDLNINWDLVNLRINKFRQKSIKYLMDKID